MTLYQKPTRGQINKNNAYLLSEIALRCIQNPELGPDNSTGLNNIYRMMELYRLTSPSFVDSEIKEVYSVIKDAAESIFPDKRRKVVAKNIEVVLRKLASPKKSEKPKEEDLRNAEKFFSHLKSELAV
ncbi:MAG TPA: hypothetical protein VJZ93_02545 [Candidatus Nanoarchaeia archaeon]|nr:hypothetical protein [Candidatus Nanoarchaeia archaeon]